MVFTLPEAKIGNVRIFYLLSMFRNMWFIEGNWLFFWLRFMTFSQLGWLDAATFGFGLLMEIPSGAVADLIGKKKTILFGAVSALVGTSFITIAQHLTDLWIGLLALNFGWALLSGADEAIVYDSLIEHKSENQFDRVLATGSVIARVTNVVSILIGGIAYAYDFRLSNLLWAGSYLLACFAALFLVEPKTDSISFSWSAYWHQLSKGVQQLFKPVFKPFVFTMLALLGSYYLYDYSLLKPALAKSFGFMESAQAGLFAILMIFGALCVQLLPMLRKRLSDVSGLYLLAGMHVLGLLSAALPMGYWGAAPLLLIVASGTLTFPWISIVVNKEIPSKYRATTLSTIALFTKLPHVVFGVLIGAAAQANKLALVVVCMAALIVITLSGRLLLVKRLAGATI